MQILGTGVDIVENIKILSIEYLRLVKFYILKRLKTNRLITQNDLLLKKLLLKQ